MALQVAPRKLAYQAGLSLGKLDDLLISQESSVIQRFLDISWLQVGGMILGLILEFRQQPASRAAVIQGSASREYKVSHRKFQGLL